MPRHFAVPNSTPLHECSHEGIGTVGAVTDGMLAASLRGDDAVGRINCLCRMDFWTIV